MNAPNTASVPDLLLVDGSSYLFRAFYAMPDMRSPDGAPTGAVFGMVTMLRKLAEQYPSLHRAVVFDAPGKTFRDEIYPEYKANRSATPEGIVAQIAPVHAIVQALGWRLVVVPGVEADDVLATLAVRAAALGKSTVISSGDKDLTQLVNDQITVVDTMNARTFDRAGVIEKFGIAPEQIIDYLTLVGDSVDNVPGVDKVGPKTAVKLLAEYGSLDALVANADQVKGAVGENLRSALSWLPTGRELITIKQDCDLTGHLEPDFWPQMRHDGEVLAELAALFQTHGFKSFTREVQARLSGALPSSKPQLGVSGSLFEEEAVVLAEPSPQRYETVLTHEALERWIETVSGASITALDTETTSLDEFEARIVGISLCCQAGYAAYIPTGHTYAGAPEQLPLAEVLAALKPWLENARYAKLGQHIKYDWHVLKNHGVDVQGFTDDTMLQSYVYEVHRPHGLESLALRHLGRKGLSYEDLCGKGAQQIAFSQVDVERATQYSCEDAEFTLLVHQKLSALIAADPKLAHVYRVIEMPAGEVLARIERNGVLIDVPRLAAQTQSISKRLIELETQAYELAGQSFNLGSPKQLGEILFTKLGMPPVKKTATGAPSTDEEVLEKLAADYPLPKLLLEHRSLAKLKGTYTEKLPKMVRPDTQRVHTHYAQAVAVTGRLASNDPNLQNIPIRTAEGRKVREAFVAPEGACIVSADYSQIELRIMAHISDDPALLAAFAAGEDVHRATAAEVFGVALAEVSSEQRRYAKVINFGLMYGMSAFGLAGNLGIERSAAQQFVDRYFARFAGVARYMQETREQAKSQGYVETVFGRRLWLPEINSPNGPRRAGAERSAINAPMQGTAADLIKLAMIAVDRELTAQGRATKMIMQVHDELVFEVPDGELAWVKSAVPRLMAEVASLKVPLLAEVGVGPNWDQAH